MTARPGEEEDAAWRLTVPPARHRRLADDRVAVRPKPAWLPVDPEILAALDRVVDG